MHLVVYPNTVVVFAHPHWLGLSPSKVERVSSPSDLSK